MDDIVHSVMELLGHAGFDPSDFLANGFEDFIQQALAHRFDPALLSYDHIDAFLQGGALAQWLSDPDFLNSVTTLISEG